jgi:hypothetical protein
MSSMCYRGIPDEHPDNAGINYVALYPALYVI